MKLPINLIVALVVPLFLAACGGDDDDGPRPTPTPAPQTIIDVAAAASNLTTLVAALEATDLDEVLDDETATFTVFAPTDAAFELLGEQTLNDLLADPETLSDILLYHVISDDEIDSARAIEAAGTTVETANGDSVGLSLSGEDLLINLATVTSVDIEAANGVIHLIDAVLTPPEDSDAPTANIVEIAAANDNFSTLVAALQATDLDDTLADEGTMYTVFAPTNEAFEVLGEGNVAALLDDIPALTAILLQHVISGATIDAVTAYSLNGTNATTAGDAQIPITITDGELRFGGAEVEDTDIPATNGVIHVIDTVVVADAGLPKPAQNIAEVATAAGSFTTLLAALEATGLDAVLVGEGPFTVFAPTDDAFAALGEETIEALLADTETLSDILQYHVISGAEVLADGAVTVAASADKFIAMTNMDNAALTLGDDDDLFINLAEIEAANVMASNGVIHVIDEVLLPPAEVGTPTANIVDTAIADGRFTTLVNALQAAGLDAALADENATYTVFAPTDAAFEAIDEGQLAALIGDVDALTDVLELHVIAGAAVDSVTAFSLNDSEVVTLGGEEIEIEIDEGSLEVGGAIVSVFDIYTTNGVIHVIDAVILGDVELPEPLLSIADIVAESDDFDTLEAALEATELDEVLDNFNTRFTVFAPTDAAFELVGEEAIDDLLQDPETLSDILLYHVVPELEVNAATAVGMAGMTVAMANGDNVGLSLSGDDLLVNLATVTMTDIEAGNGIIHVIDAVLTPPADIGMPALNIVETAVEAGNFTTLVTALQIAELDAVLANEDEQFTVFAPTDAAFALIDEAVLAGLLEDVPALSNVLLQHVISASTVDSITAFTFNGTAVNTAADEDVTIEIVDGVLEIQGSAVSTFDIYANNGVIHVIDAVITETLQ